MLLKRLGRYEEERLSELRKWAHEQKLERAVKSRYAPNRLEAWFRLAVHLGTGVHAEAPEPPQHVVSVGDDLMPGWASLLLIGGDTTIGPHRDAAGFERDVVMVNLGQSEYMWWPLQRVEGAPERTIIEDGECVLINSKVLHAARPRPGRMALTFRRVPAQTLSLFIDK